MLQVGFGKMDVTPRVGVELCGFGPFLNRHSIGVRDRLWARALAARVGQDTALVISCDLVGFALQTTQKVRGLIHQATGVPTDAIILQGTHTHSGPNTYPDLIGWGDQDAPYMAMLPGRVAQAGIAAVNDLKPARLSHARVPCEGVALNREYDKDAPPLEEVLRDDWRPAKPELTDGACHVARIDRDGAPVGFFSYFGCHPVVCCQQTRYIHGDFCGVATNMLERELGPGTIGLFLQGAQGDVNSCVVHKPEPESLLALDVIASRYARAVRRGLAEARPVNIDRLRWARRDVTFARRTLAEPDLLRRRGEHLAEIEKPGASDDDRALRMAAVYLIAIDRLLGRLSRGESVTPPTEVQGVRLGPIAMLACGFEIFQAIKNDVVKAARAPIPLVMGCANDALGYAPDRTAAARGGYAADTVPMMLGQMPFADTHGELARALSELDAELAA